MKDIQQIKREMEATERSIRICAASIATHNEKIDFEKKQMLQHRTWLSALEWALESDEQSHE